ncbi:CheR family methyltransferase [Caulobacter sp. KR2-114]|uniref:CheR family methyltransferase n=1 Tax=Caulobacter sp. KR2-114 TaxID=3400912 RepID=UPI003C0FC332
MSEPARLEMALSADEVTRFCEFLYRRTGMTFGEGKRYYIDRRIAERMAATGDESFAEYFARVRNEPGELEAAINAFTVNETYFYRELHQLEALSAHILPEIVRGKGAGDRVRVWSLPCSTGEEPYSIALWLLENWRLVDAYHIEIDGSDIDTRALSEARAGRYAPRSLQRLPQKVLDDYFEPEVDGQRTLIRDIRESVTFSTANLVDRASLQRQGAFEVIFCRNVLIYFDDAARRTVAENLYESLAPGGFVCLGHTESMGRIDDRFRVRRFGDTVVYQRPPA